MIAVASGEQAPAKQPKKGRPGLEVQDDEAKVLRARAVSLVLATAPVLDGQPPSREYDAWIAVGRLLDDRATLLERIAGMQANDHFKRQSRTLRRRLEGTHAELRAQGAVIELLKLKHQHAVSRVESEGAFASGLRQLAERKATDGQVLAAQLKASHEELARVEQERDQAKDLLKVTDARLESIERRLEKATTVALAEPDAPFVPPTEPF